jgi:hypothetical protein
MPEAPSAARNERKCISQIDLRTNRRLNRQSSRAGLRIRERIKEERVLTRQDWAQATAQQQPTALGAWWVDNLLCHSRRGRAAASASSSASTEYQTKTKHQVLDVPMSKFSARAGVPPAARARRSSTASVCKCRARRCGAALPVGSDSCHTFRAHHTPTTATMSVPTTREPSCFAT